MSRFLVAVLGALLVVNVGCQNKGSGDDAKMMSNDVCTMCPGVQKATADGKCPGCGMKLTDAKMMSADACPHCPGVQKASADGKCAQCEAKKAAKGASAGDACAHCP